MAGDLRRHAIQESRRHGQRAEAVWRSALLEQQRQERRLGIAGPLAACFVDRRDPARIDHTVAEMIGFRAIAIAAG